MPKVIVPIGLQFGPSYVDDSKVPQHFTVGRASSPRYLTEPQRAVWVLAYGDYETARRLGMSRRELERRAEDKGVRNAGRVIDDLLRTGDLDELDTGRGKSKEFLQRYRLKPLGYGFGNDPDDREVSLLGPFGQPGVLRVPSEVLTVWEMGLTACSIWHRVEMIAEGRKRRNADKSYSSEVDVVAEWVAQAMPLVLATGCGYLDEDADVVPSLDE